MASASAGSTVTELVGIRQLLEKPGLSGEAEFAYPTAPDDWPRLKVHLAAIFCTRTRAEWCALLDDTDVCFAPVLSLSEAPSHPHNVARGTFVEVDGLLQPSPAPRFLGTPAPPVRLTRR